MTSNEHSIIFEKVAPKWQEAQESFYKKDYQIALALFDEIDRDLENWIAEDEIAASMIGLVANQAFVSAYETNQFQRALYFAEKEYSLADRYSPGYARALNNKGLALLELGRLLEAETSFKEALSSLDGYSDDKIVSFGVDVHKLRNVVRRHLAILSDTRLEPEGNMLEFVELTNSYPQHDTCILGSFAFGIPDRDEVDVVNKAFLKAKIAEKSGDFTRMIQTCADAVGVLRKSSSAKKALGLALSNLGYSYLSAGMFTKAVVNLQEAADILKETIRPSEQLAIVLYGISIALFKMHKREEALGAAKHAWIEIKESAPDTPNALKLLYQLALLRWLTKDLKRARAALYHAMQIYDNNRKRLADSEAKHSGLFALYRSMVELMLIIAVHEQWPDEAMALIENAKARFWNDHLESLYSTNHTERFGTASYKDSELALDESRAGSHEITHIGNYITDPECLLINFFTGPNCTFAVSFLDGRLQANRIDISENDLQKEIEAFLKDIQSSSRRELWRESGKMLATKLLGSIQVATPWPKQIQVVPDGPLWYLPLDFLPLNGSGGEEETGKPIFTIAPTAYIPSTKLLNRYRSENLKSQKAQSLTILAIARSSFSYTLSNLNSVEDEIEVIEKLSTNNGFRAIREHEATRNSVVQQLGSADVIHIATHILANSQETRSKIVLSDGAGGDDYLWAYEIAELKLYAQVVFLSACSSAVGQLSAGEGLKSIARAFLLAGCQSVVASLWPIVDIIAPNFVGLFYKNLFNRYSPAEALQLAKQTAVEKGIPNRVVASFQIYGGVTPSMDLTSVAALINAGLEES